MTRLAQFEVNDRDLADVGATGLVSTRHVPGVFAVMARYQTHVAAFRRWCRWAESRADAAGEEFSG